MVALLQACLRRWRWVITSATFAQFFLVLGPQFSFSILFVSLQTEFESNAVTTGWLGSLSAAIARLFSPVTVLLERRLSKRAVALLGLVFYCAGLLMTSFVPALGYAYITYGILSGIGVNLTLHASLELLLKWFAKDNFSRASALALLGSTCGLLAFSPLLTVLITSYGWRNALRVLSGGIFLMGVAGGLLLTDPPTAARDSSALQNRAVYAELNNLETAENPVAENPVAEREQRVDDQQGDDQQERNLKGEVTQRNWRQMLRMARSVELWLWSVANLLTFTGWTFFNINFASYMDGLGLNSDQIAYAIMGLAGGEIGGKVLVALIGDRLPFTYLYVVVASGILAAVPLGLMTVATTFAEIMPIAVASGFLRAGAYGTLYTAGAELFLEMYGTGVVMVLTIVPPGIGILVSAPVSGYLFDVTGNYFVSLVVIAAIFICASVAFLLIQVRRKIRSRGSRCPCASGGQPELTNHIT